jgi:hypothetical protein
MNAVVDHKMFAFPLGRLALCLDCEMCFDVGRNVCPACASRTFVPVARFLERQTADN